MATATIEDGEVACVVDHVSRTLPTPNSPRYEAIRIRSLGSSDNSQVIDLRDSPIWRLDFRKIEDLFEETVLAPARWQLIPSLDPLANRPTPSFPPSTLAWVDVTGEEASLEITQNSSSEVELRWSNLPFDAWVDNRNGRFNVRVLLRFPGGGKPLEGSIHVEVNDTTQASADLVLNSVCFPDFYLRQLSFENEPDPDDSSVAFDDLLMVPFQHGYLIADPIKTLSGEGYASGKGVGSTWPQDTDVSDYSAHIAELTYPGEVPFPFICYYDVEDEAYATDPWILISDEGPKDVIRGYGERLSMRGGGPCLYMGAHDPDLNLKRVLTESRSLGPGRPNALRLAIRSFVDFRSDRLAIWRRESIDPARIKQGYAQGNFSDLPNFRDEDAVYAWPMALDFLSNGDWLDAAMIYREFLVDKSRALYRSPSAPEGPPVKFWNLPSAAGGPEGIVLPDAYKHLVATIGLSEVVPQEESGNPPVFDPDPATVNLQRYIAWLRDDWHSYRLPEHQGAGAPYLAVAHPEGMYRLGENLAIKSSGNAQANTEPRPGPSFDPKSGTAEFFQRLRNETPDRNILTLLNRDTGSWRKDDAPDKILKHKTSKEVSAFRENGSKSLRNAVGTGFAVSHARLKPLEDPNDFEIPGQTNLRLLLEACLDKFEIGGEPQVDWLWISGQASVAKLDYWGWREIIESPGLELYGTGGGNRWAIQFQDMLNAFLNEEPILSNQSPRLYFSTERLNEMTLIRNGSRGHRRVYPISNRDGAGAWSENLAVYGEPLTLTSYLLHDYTLMVCDALSFAKYWALPFKQNIDKRELGFCTDPENNRLDPRRFFDQTTTEGVFVGTLASLRELACLVIDAGTVPSFAVEISGEIAFECRESDPDTPLARGDRLSTTFSNKLAVGPDDLATDNDSSFPQVQARRLIRGRSHMIQFFNGGRRIRDPKLLEPASPPAQANWWMKDLLVKRWENPDLEKTSEQKKIIDMGVATQRLGDGILLPTLVLGTFAVDDSTILQDGLRVMTAVYYPSASQSLDQDLHYDLDVDGTRWPAGVLDPNKTYKVGLLDEARNSLIPIGHFELTPATSHKAVLSTQTIEFDEPLVPGGLHFWVFQEA